MKVGFIGLGSMGLPIARHVLQAGHTVVVYNRTRSRADALKPLQPAVADSPAAAARSAEVLVTMFGVALPELICRCAQPALRSSSEKTQARIAAS